MTTPRIGSEFLVNTSTATAQSQPALTTLADGRFVAAWTDDSANGADANGGAIRYQLFEANGTPVGPERIAVTEAGADNSVFNPAVVTLSDGRFLIGWQRFVPGPDTSHELHAIDARFFNADGTPDGDQFSIVSHPDDTSGGSIIDYGPLSNFNLASTSSGGFAVTYFYSFFGVGAFVTNSHGIAFKAYNLNGDALGATTKGWADFIGGPSVQGGDVTALSDGRYAFGWIQGSTQAQLFTGASAGAGFEISPSASGALTLTALANGRLLATLGGVAQIFDANGGKHGDPFQVQAESVAVLEGGQFVVAFQDLDASGSGIYARVYNANGLPSGDAFLVNTTTAQSQFESEITALANGGFVVAWRDDSQSGGDTSSGAVRAQVFGVPEGFRGGTPDPDILLGTNAIGETLNGLGGDDTLSGLGGSDVITGGAGNDTIDGGADRDWAFFSAARSEYDIRTFASGPVLKTIVAHQGGTQADGTDTLTSVEVLDFANRTFNLARAQLNHTSNVDGDRFDDVLFQNQTTGQVNFAKMVDGVFQSWNIDTGPYGIHWKAIGSGDVNPGPTGGAETFFQEQFTSTIAYASLDTGSLSWVTVNAPGLAWKLRAVGDMNGDAAADAVLQNTVTGAIKYAAMFNGTFQGYDLITDKLSTNWLLIGVGDVNRNGLADAIVQNQSTGAIYYFGVANGVQSFGTVIDHLNPAWHAKAVADLTGDGFADVIVQDVSTGNTLFIDMKNGVFDHWGVVTTSVTSDWVAQGTADVDNDGFADVLFQNATNGTTQYANMGPAGFEGWGAVASNGADWHVV